MIFTNCDIKPRNVFLIPHYLRFSSSWVPCYVSKTEINNAPIIEEKKKEEKSQMKRWRY